MYTKYMTDYFHSMNILKPGTPENLMLMILILVKILYAQQNQKGKGSGHIDHQLRRGHISLAGGVATGALAVSCGIECVQQGNGEKHGRKNR